MPARAVVASALLVLAASPSAAGNGPDAVRPATGPAPAASASGAASRGYVAPVSPVRVVRAFRAPATRYGPGHRGVDLAARSGTAVRSAAAGSVRFAGAVAGRGVIVVRHADGISTEYEPVRPLVRAGGAVGEGQVIGYVQGTHVGCPAACLHWGARRDGEYLDPLALLRPLGPVVLLPWPHDG